MRLPRPAFFDGVDLMCYDDMGLVFQAFPVISFFMMSSENSSFRMDLTPQHYLRSVSDFDNPLVDQTCVKYGFLTSDTGTVLGAIFMEAFYVVFDRANQRMGFAQTSCPWPDPDHKVLDVSIEGPFASTSKNFSQCAFKKPVSEVEKVVPVSIIVILAFSLIVFVPFILLVVFKIRKTCCRYRHLREDEKQMVMSQSPEAWE